MFMTLLKKITLSSLLFLISFFSFAQAQFIFHVEYDSLQPAFPDSGAYGDTLGLGFRIYNNGLTSFNGVVAMQIRTSLGQFQLGDTAFMSIAPQTSSVINIHDTIRPGRFAPGGVNVIVIWPTSPNFLNTDSIKDNILITSVGIEDGSDADFDVQIYPNPTADQLYFRQRGPLRVKEAVLTNMAGQVIFQQDGLPGTLSLEDLPKGYYILRLRAASGAVATFKVCRD